MRSVVLFTEKIYVQAKGMADGSLETYSLEYSKMEGREKAVAKRRRFIKKKRTLPTFKGNQREMIFLKKIDLSSELSHSAIFLIRKRVRSCFMEFFSILHVSPDVHAET